MKTCSNCNYEKDCYCGIHNKDIKEFTDKGLDYKCACWMKKLRRDGRDNVIRK